MNPFSRQGPGFLESVVSSWGTLTGTVIILANLVPAAGLLFFGWTVYSVVFLYWAENIVIGLFQVLRLAVSRMPAKAKIFVIPFFCVHYGLFCAVHGVFVVVLFGGALGVERPQFQLPPDIGTALFSLMAMHAFLFVKDAVIDREIQTANPMTLMMEPYVRLVALHIFIIGSGGLVMSLGMPPVVLVVVILAKTAWDCRVELLRRA